MKKPFFLLLISGTDLIKYPGISAAGASHEALRYTAKLDAEFLKCHCERLVLPISPHGIVSPALITKACLNLLDAEILILDLGAHEKPNCSFISIRDKPSADISKENAFNLREAQQLYLRGTEFLGTKIYNYGFNPKQHELIIAECLVGGTTTALGLLTGLGFDCFDLISSSFPNGNHTLKKELINNGLQRIMQEQNFKAQVIEEPLLASAALGDCLQPFIAGIAATAIDNQIAITLAGGTQMLAIKALIDRKLPSSKLNELITLVTTPWIVNDKSANFNKLLSLVSPQSKLQIPDIDCILANKPLKQEVQNLSENLLARKLNLEEIISNYNQGHVKEGVGLGAVLSLIN